MGSPTPCTHMHINIRQSKYRHTLCTLMVCTGSQWRSVFWKKKYILISSLIFHLTWHQFYFLILLCFQIETKEQLEIANFSGQEVGLLNVRELWTISIFVMQKRFININISNPVVWIFSYGQRRFSSAKQWNSLPYLPPIHHQILHACITVQLFLDH